MSSFYMRNFVIDFLKEKNVEISDFFWKYLQSDFRLNLSIIGDCRRPHEYAYIELYNIIKDKIDINDCINMCMTAEIDFINKSNCLENYISAETFYNEILKLNIITSSNKDGTPSVIDTFAKINQLIKRGFLLKPIYLGDKRLENAVYSKNYAIYFLLTLQNMLHDFDNIDLINLEEETYLGGNKKQYYVLRLSYNTFHIFIDYYAFDFNVELISHILATKETKYKQIWRYLTKKGNEIQSVLNTIYGKPEIAKELNMTVAKLENLIKNNVIVIVNKENNKVIRNKVEYGLYNGKSMKIDYTPKSIGNGNGYFSLRRFYVNSYRNKLKVRKD